VGEKATQTFISKYPTATDVFPPDVPKQLGDHFESTGKYIDLDLFDAFKVNGWMDDIMRAITTFHLEFNLANGGTGVMSKIGSGVVGSAHSIVITFHGKVYKYAVKIQPYSITSLNELKYLKYMSTISQTGAPYSAWLIDSAREQKTNDHIFVMMLADGDLLKLATAPAVAFNTHLENISIIKQTLASIMIFQVEARSSHRDAHAGNFFYFIKDIDAQEYHGVHIPASHIQVVLYDPGTAYEFTLDGPIDALEILGDYKYIWENLLHSGIGKHDKLLVDKMAACHSKVRELMTTVSCATPMSTVNTLFAILDDPTVEPSTTQDHMSPLFDSDDLMSLGHNCDSGKLLRSPPVERGDDLMSLGGDGFKHDWEHDWEFDL